MTRQIAFSLFSKHIHAMKILESYFDFWNHPRFTHGSLDYMRNRIRIAGFSIGMCTGIFYTLSSSFLGYELGTIIGLIITGFNLYLLCRIRFGLFTNLEISNSLNIFIFIVINIVVFTTGGPASPIWFWVLTIISYSFWIAGNKNGLTWTVIFLALYAFMIILKRNGYPFVNSLSEENATLFQYCLFFGSLCHAALVLCHFNNWRDAVYQEIKELNQLKDRMISMVGHDLKNPLNLLMGIHKYSGNNPEIKQAYYETCNELQLRMKRIIENMMLFDRIENKTLKIEPEKVHLKKIIDSIIKENRQQLRIQDIKVDCAVDEQTFLESSDSVSLERIFSNLISNSIKYSPKGTTIEITSKIVDKDIFVKIKDQGIGIEKIEQESLFQIYKKGKSAPLSNSASSTGIGLYIVKYLAELLKGEIKVHSEGKNRGCEFTLRLPLRQDFIS